MTLSLEQFLANIIQKEFKIAHLDAKIWAGKMSKVKSAIKSSITAEYGEKFLADADYMLFAKGAALSESNGIKRLFKAVNSALGKSANTLSMSDFKKMTVKDSDDSADIDDTVDTTDSDIDADNENADIGEAETDGAANIDYVFVKITLK